MGISAASPYSEAPLNSETAIFINTTQRAASALHAAYSSFKNILIHYSRCPATHIIR